MNTHRQLILSIIINKITTKTIQEESGTHWLYIFLNTNVLLIEINRCMYASNNANKDSDLLIRQIFSFIH